MATEAEQSEAAAVARSKFGARPAEFADTIGKRSNYLFAVNARGHRISARTFYRKDGEDGEKYFRDGYLLVTKAGRFKAEANKVFGTGLF